MTIAVAKTTVTTIDLVGTVTMARVDRPRLTLRLADGRSISAAFPPSAELIVLEALRTRVALRLRGRGRLAADGSLLRVTRTEVVILEPPVPVDRVAEPKPIWHRIQDIMSKVPAEELEKLPHDGAEQHDHYLYGTPKR
jgi:hypothetical protein